QDLVAAVGPLKCDIDLPSSWTESLGETGPISTMLDDRRRHPRYGFRTRAALEYRQTFPTFPRPGGWHLVFTKGLSRGGFSFLHGEQLFPRERMRIALPGLGMSVVEIVWSLRLQHRCFQVGSRFVEHFRDLTSVDGELGQQA
ncbi:MAG: hypothetical protein ACYTG0_39640, partial [Planctomycetota bacterium]